MNKYNCILILSLIAAGVLLLVILNFSVSDSSIYMDIEDPGNPIGYNGLYITNEIKYLAEDITRDFDGEHNKTIAILKYVDETIRVNNTIYTPYPHTILDVQEGVCGHFAILSSSMLASIGIPAHIIAMCGDFGHVAIECYYDKKWHYYDPTFIAFWEQGKSVLSFEELKAGGARNATLHVGNITRYHLYEGVPRYLTPQYYEMAHPSGVASRECPLTLNCEPCSDSMRP